MQKEPEVWCGTWPLSITVSTPRTLYLSIMGCMADCPCHPSCHLMAHCAKGWSIPKKLLCTFLFSDPKESRNQDPLLRMENNLFSFICNSNFHWSSSTSLSHPIKHSISSHDLIMVFRIIVFPHRSSTSKINVFSSTEAAESPKLLYFSSESQAH